jgi:hypothetical protein
MFQLIEEATFKTWSCFFFLFLRHVPIDCRPAPPNDREKIGSSSARLHPGADAIKG